MNERDLKRVAIVNGLLVKDRQVLMAHRSPSRRSYPDTWSFPGGHVEPGETLEDSLARELCEEIGVQLGSRTFLKSVPVGATASDAPVTFHFFVVESWQGDIQNLGDEHSELRWVDFADASSMPRLALPTYVELFTMLSAR